MPDVRNPIRNRVFRLTTVAASGIGGFMLAIWSMQLVYGNEITGLPPQTIIAIIGALGALSAAGSALSFFAGVGESVDFVVRETQFDKLTGLKARSAMIEKIGRAAARSIQTGEPMFLVDIDIDRFKQINDAIGYSQGDELIRAFARRLMAFLPKGIVVGRIGAGEFAALFADREIAASFEATLEALIERMTEPYQLSTHLQSVNLSVGVVAIPKDGTDPVTLLRRSNLALQHARMGGVASWAVFREEMGEVAEYRQWVEAELGAAFERGEFEMYYQPQFNLRTGALIGYEALIRWNHPERGIIAPMKFIPVAEETGMIVPLGEWALRRACLDTKQLSGECQVAVNISPVQFMTRDFVATVRRILKESGMASHRLELEVTETAMMQDRKRAAEILKQLAAMGISVAVDDFGTGYSNLSYLTDFSFHRLKIDRSFVQRMESDRGSSAIVSTIVGLARAMEVQTIAEGVETETQAALLKAAGCEAVQGFLYGRPEPLAAVEARLRASG
jgi:diguanylate cyclase (GGDEF)-like protein